MNTIERIETLKAMDRICRALNDEEVFEEWIMYGVEDGLFDDELSQWDIDYYTEDKRFADIMDTFAHVMKNATRKDEWKGAFFVDGVVRHSDT